MSRRVGAARASGAGRVIALVVLAVGAAGPAGAQQPLPPPGADDPSVPPPADAADTLVLTLPAAVERALERSEEVRRAREDVALAEAQITQARAGALPQVNANLNYDRTLRSVFDVGDAPPEEPPPGEEPPIDFGELFGDLPFGQPNTWIASLQVDQAIYTGGRLGAATEIARRVRAATRLQLAEAEAEIARDVRDAFFQAVFTESLVVIAEEAYTLADEQVRQVESFYEQGTASEFELVQARVERDNLEPQIVEARNARVLAMLELKRLTNVPQGQPVELRFELADDVAVAEVDPDRILRAALRRPRLRAAAEQERIEEERIRLARAEGRPNVAGFANFSYQAFPEDIVPTGLPVFGDEWREDWGVGLRVSVPIFDGFRTRGAIEEARANVRRAELQTSQIREAIEVEVAAALAEFRAARAQLEARRATVAEAARGLELAELRYENGLSTLIEVSNARLLLQQARVNEAESVFAYLSALAALEHASGGQIPLVERALAGEST